MYSWLLKKAVGVNVKENLRLPVRSVFLVSIFLFFFPIPNSLLSGLALLLFPAENIFLLIKGLATLSSDTIETVLRLLVLNNSEVEMNSLYHKNIYPLLLICYLYILLFIIID